MSTTWASVSLFFALSHSEAECKKFCLLPVIQYTVTQSSNRMITQKLGSPQEWIKKRRKSLGMTQQELADKVGCSKGTLNKIETGHRRPSRAMALRLAEILEIPYDLRESFLRALRATQLQKDSDQPAVHGVKPAGVVSNHAPIPLKRIALIGRAREIEDLRRHLHDPTTRLLSVVGPAGVGKTQLVLEVVAGLDEVYPDGVWWISLIDIENPDLLIPIIAQTLGICEELDESLLETLIATIASRRLLLILDGCERMRSANKIVLEILARCQYLTIVTTSRIALHLALEQIYPLAPLDHYARAHPDRPPASSAAVMLLIERARECNPIFHPSDADLQACEAICQQLDGLPLAIEIAAAQLRTLSVAELATQLQYRLASLVSCDHDVPHHQRSLRAALDWSYQLLNTDEQYVFQSLGVFRGSFSLDAVEAIVPDSAKSVRSHMTTFVDHSLLVTFEDPIGGTRYQLLETIRAYAVHKLDVSGRQMIMRQQHAQFYFQRAKQMQATVENNLYAYQAHLIALESANLRSALDWLLDHGELAKALDVSSALWYYWIAQGQTRLGWDWLQQTLVRDGLFPSCLGLMNATNWTQPLVRLPHEQRHDEFVGRQQELEQLDRWLQPLWQARKSPGVCVIVAPAGQGKSTLIGRLYQRIPQAATVVWLQGETSEINPTGLYPFVTLLRRFLEMSRPSNVSIVEWLRQHVDQLLQRLPEQVGNQLHYSRPWLSSLLSEAYGSLAGLPRTNSWLINTQRAILVWLCALSLQQPLVICLEDLHWLDEDSLVILIQLIQRMHQYPLALIATSRTADIVSVLCQHQNTQQKCHIIQLAPLSFSELAELSHHILAAAPDPVLVQQLMAKTDGQPFLAVEYLLALRDGRAQHSDDVWQQLMQWDLTTLLQHRVACMTKRTQQVIQIAAVLGYTADLLVLLEVLRFLDDETQTVIYNPQMRRELQSFHYFFRHNLVWSTTYQSQNAQELQRLHRLAAQTLERLYADDVRQHAHVLAYHYRQAGVDAQELYYLRLAAEQAMQRGMYHDVVRHVSRLLELIPRGPNDEHYHLLLDIEHAYHCLGYRIAQKHVLDDLTLLVKSLSEAELSTINVRWARYFNAISQYSEALQAAGQAIDGATQWQQWTVCAEGLAEQSLAYVRKGCLDDAQRVTDQLLALGQASGDRLRTVALITRGFIAFERGQMSVALADYEQAQILARRMGDEKNELRCVINISNVYHARGDIAAALRLQQVATTLSLKIGDRLNEVLARGNSAVLLGDLGVYPEAIAELEYALSIAEEIADQDSMSWILANLGCCLVQVGRLDEAEQACRRAYQMAVSMVALDPQGDALLYLGHALYARHDAAGAAAAYAQSYDIRCRLGQARHRALEPRAGWAAALQQLGQYAQAHEHVTAMLEVILPFLPDGLDDPLRTLLNCYTVLAAHNDQRARDVLEVGYRCLHHRAGLIRDRRLRRSYLEQVTVHAEFLRIWKMSR